MKRIMALIVIFSLHIPACGGKKEMEKQAEPRGRRLRVATYNVNYFTGGYAGIRDTVREIGPEVIALQEVLLKNGVDYSKKLADDLKLHHLSSAPYVSFDGINWVTAFLSVYPVKRWSQTRLGYRNALKIVIGLGETEVTLVTMHLTPFVWSDANLLQANRNMARLRQKEIAGLIRWTGDAEPPVVLLGDFNSLPFMGELSPLLDLGYRDAYAEKENGIEGTFTIHASVKAALKRALPGYPVPDTIKLDYILISPGIKIAAIETRDSRASDHNPLVADLLIEAAGAR